MLRLICRGRRRSAWFLLLLGLFLLSQQAREKALGTRLVIGYPRDLITSIFDRYITSSIKVAQNSFQHFPRRRFWWRVIITTIYQLMLQSWYQETAQSLVNTLLLFSWHNRLPQQHYDLLKTPLISPLSTYISETARWNFFLLQNFNKQDKMQLLAKF